MEPVRYFIKEIVKNLESSTIKTLPRASPLLYATNISFYEEATFKYSYRVIEKDGWDLKLL
jgi:hypothetical protein